MRWLMGAVIGMGVLIVAGVAVLAVLLIQRMSAVPPRASSAATFSPASSAATLSSTSSAAASTPTSFVPGAAPASLDEPAGTRIVAVSLAPDRIAVLLAGAGPDRVLVLDPAGHVLTRIALAR